MPSCHSSSTYSSVSPRSSVSNRTSQTASSTRSWDSHDLSRSSKSLRTLIWFAGGNPHKVKNIRRYETTYEDVPEHKSSFSLKDTKHRGKTEVSYAFVYSNNLYGSSSSSDDSHVSSSRSRGRKSRSSHRRSGRRGRHHDDNDDYDDNYDNQSAMSGFGPPPPGAMHGMPTNHMGPPPPNFAPPPPRQDPGFVNLNGQQRGFGGSPPPPPMNRGPPQPGFF